MYTLDDLKNKTQLSPDPVKRTLLACGLDPNAKQFSQQDLDRFLAARQMLKEKPNDPKDKGKTAYERIAERFGGTAPIRKSVPKSEASKSLSSGNGRGREKALPVETGDRSKTVSVSEGQEFDVPTLQARSSDLGFHLEFGDLVELLEACEISVDGEAIAAERVEQFDEALELLMQGKSLKDIRSHFGLSVAELKTYTLPELVNTSKENGHRVGYGQAVKAIKALGLDPNTREYSASQAKAIWKAFELVAAGESLEEISKLSQDGLSVPNELMFEQFAERDSSTQLQTMNELADVRAQGMGPVMAKMELAALLRELREGEGYRQVWKQLGDYVKARANGQNPKSQSSFGNPSGSRLLRD